MPVAGFLDCFPVEAFLIDPEDGALTAVNRPALQRLGYAAEEFLRLSYFALDRSRSRDDALALLRQVRSGAGKEVPARFHGGDGGAVDFRVSFTAMEVGGSSFILAVCVDMTEQKRVEAALREQHGRGYRASEQVRRQIARELHDGVGQDLTGLLLGLSALEDAFTDTSDRADCRILVELAATIGGKLQRLAWEQQPSSLEDFGLLQAVESYTAQWAEKHGITLTLHGGNLGAVRLAPDVEIIAFRVVQGLLADLSGNRRARLVSLVLERRKHELQMIIEHDGEERSGQQEDAAEGDERLAFVGGTLTVESGCGLGTTLYVRIPLEPEELS